MCMWVERGKVCRCMWVEKGKTCMCMWVERGKVCMCMWVEKGVRVGGEGRSSLGRPSATHTHTHPPTHPHTGQPRSLLVSTMGAAARHSCYHTICGVPLVGIFRKLAKNTLEIHRKHSEMTLKILSLKTLSLKILSLKILSPSKVGGEA